MRLGEEDEPRQQLETCLQQRADGCGDRRTACGCWIATRTSSRTKDDTTILRLKKKEADLLRPYFEEQLHKAIATY